MIPSRRRNNVFSVREVLLGYICTHMGVQGAGSLPGKTKERQISSGRSGKEKSMSKLKKRILSFGLALILVLTMIPTFGVFAFAGEEEQPLGFMVFLTVSNQGKIAEDAGGSLMSKVRVFVDDLDGDGKYTFYEALVAAHDDFLSEDGFAVKEDGWVTKLWGIASKAGYSFFLNDLPTGLVTETEIHGGDDLVASVNQDSSYYSDVFSYFDGINFLELTTDDDPVTLTVKGYVGMAELPVPEPLSGATVSCFNADTGVYEDAVYTDENGQVTLLFDEPGFYIVSSGGTLKDQEIYDWSTQKTVTVDLPIIANCILVNVEEGLTPPEGTILVRMTVSDQGEIVESADGDVMANKRVFVWDLDEDGVYTLDEALVSLHKTYFGSEDGYAVSEDGWVTKLWGIANDGNYSFIRENLPTGLVTETALFQDDCITVSINEDSQYWNDFYTAFDKFYSFAEAGKDYKVRLCGYPAMSMTPELEPLPGLSLAYYLIDEEGNVEYHQTNTITDAEGFAPVNFPKAGFVILTANGVVKNQEVFDWETSTTVTVDSPIIAPYLCFEVVDGPYEVADYSGIEKAKAEAAPYLENRELYTEDSYLNLVRAINHIFYGLPQEIEEKFHDIALSEEAIFMAIKNLQLKEPVVVDGWTVEGGVRYYVKDGKHLTGWLEYEGDWYYLDPDADGAMATGWRYVDGSWYYLDSGYGKMATGWLFEDGTWYYLNANGSMATGWVLVNNIWYYLKASGAMAANEWCGGYWLNGDGSWTYQPVGTWKLDNAGWWFGDTSGWYAANGPQKIDDVIYQFDAAGYWIG